MQLGILLFLAAIYLMVQNGTGVMVATLARFDQLSGVIGGSVSLSGGHGTAIAWAPFFRDEHGIALASELGIASVTLQYSLLNPQSHRPLVQKAISALMPSSAVSQCQGSTNRY